MTHRGKRTGSWVALAAAYLLFVQALLTGASLGAQAAPVAVDFHGAVICHPSALDDAAPAAPDGHGGAATCCVLGCAAGGAVLPPPGAAALAAPARRNPDLVPPRADAPLALPGQRTPRHTRAPPLA